MSNHRKGDRFRVRHDWPTLERYEDFERLLVPPDILADAEYDHFVFAVSADDVVAHLDELTGHA
jgi:hypothetical protein